MNYNFPSNLSPYPSYLPAFNPPLIQFNLLGIPQQTLFHQQFFVQNNTLENMLCSQNAMYLNHVKALQYQHQSIQNQLTQEIKFKTELFSKEASTLQRTNDTTPRLEKNLSELESIKYEEDSYIEKEQEDQESPKKVELTSFESKVHQLLDFFVKNYDDRHLDIIKEQREKYEEDEQFSDLIEVFDLLAMRFKSAAKCREDMVRFVMRKAVTWIRDSYRNENNVLAKEAIRGLCKKYFPEKYKILQEKYANDDDADEKIVNEIFPYKKNSKHKTANNDHIKEIFASEEFYQDYIRFFGNFDEIIQEESEKKSLKFVKFICKCIEEKKHGSIKTFKRLPWLDSWVNATKAIARELKNKRGSDGPSRKPKEFKNKKVKL